MLELGRRTAKPCMGLVCVNGKRHLALAEAVSLGGWWDTCKGVNCVLCPMGITAGGRGARCWPWGRAWAEVSKGCLSQKHWPMHTQSCLTKRSKEEHTLFSLASVGLLVCVLSFYRGLSDPQGAGLCPPSGGWAWGFSALKHMSALAVCLLLVQDTMWWVGRQVFPAPSIFICTQKGDSHERDAGDTCKLYLCCILKLCWHLEMGHRINGHSRARASLVSCRVGPEDHSRASSLGTWS